LENKGVLVYCVVEKFDDRISDIDGICADTKLYAIESGGLSAVVSDVGLDEYGEDVIAEKGEDIEWLKEKATLFMDVMLNIMFQTRIIPMKFLTIFLTEDRVRETVDSNAEHFGGIFEKIRGCEELSVKVYCDSKKFKEETVSEEIERFEKTLAGKPKGASFFLKKKFEAELDDKIQNRICGICNRFAEELSGCSAETKTNKVLAKEITGIEKPMITNCAFLVRSDKTDVFREKAGAFAQENEKNGFLVEATGPWPPYSFC